MPENEIYENLLSEDTLRVMDCTKDYDVEEELYDDASEDGDLLESMQLNLLDMKIEKGRGSCAEGHRDLRKSIKAIQQKGVGAKASMRSHVQLSLFLTL